MAQNKIAGPESVRNYADADRRNIRADLSLPKDPFKSKKYQNQVLPAA